MVGGEFEIDLSLLRDGFVESPDTYYFASGRTALYQIIKSLDCARRKVWMPDWLCHTMVDAVERAGFECVYYELDNHYKTTVEALDRSGFQDGDTVLMVNYFGLQKLNETAKSIKEAYPHAIVIEDDVQAYWELAERENPYADYRFTSLRKALPIPDGGLVYTKRPMPKATERNTFAPLKFQAGVMKLNRGKEGINDDDYLKLFKQGDALIPENYDSVMSDDSKRLYAGTDFQKVKQQRQANAKHLLEGLAAIGIKPMIDVPVDSVPLFVPIWLENRDEVRKRLFQHEIFCPVHWPFEGMSVKKGKDMADHELSLIVDQRYALKDMDLILSLL